MSINKASLLNEIREAVGKKKTETGERNAVVRVLAKHGAYKTPKIETGRFGKGSSLRIYIWDTKWGTLVLSSGPSVEGEVQYADKRQLKDAPEGSYHVLEKATGTSKITNAMKKIAAREEVTGSTTVSKPKRKKAAPKRKKKAAPKKAAPKKETLKESLLFAPKRTSFGTFRTWPEVMTIYGRNEDVNRHSENYLLLAEALRKPPRTIEVFKDIIKKQEKGGGLSADEINIQREFGAGHYAEAKEYLEADLELQKFKPSILVETRADVEEITNDELGEIHITDIGEENIYFEDDRHLVTYYAKEPSEAYSYLDKYWVQADKAEAEAKKEWNERLEQARLTGDTRDADAWRALATKDRQEHVVDPSLGGSRMENLQMQIDAAYSQSPIAVYLSLHPDVVARDAIDGEDFYTFWERTGGTWSIDRSQYGAGLRGDNALWEMIYDAALTSRPIGVFEQGFNPNEDEADRADLRAVAAEPETMSEADEVAEMMQQLQALIAAKK